MMLSEKLSADMKESMKAGDKKKTGVLRMILSELKYAQTGGDAKKELSNDDVLKVVTSYHKRLIKSLDEYPEGEKRVNIQDEIKIVEGYLPQKAGADATLAAIDKVLASTAERQFGKLMKDVMAILGEAADGKLISELLKKKLS